MFLKLKGPKGLVLISARAVDAISAGNGCTNVACCGVVVVVLESVEEVAKKVEDALAE